MVTDPMSKESSNHHFLRLLVAVVLAIAGLSYTVFVLTGHIPESRQLSATHLALLVLVAIGVVLLISPRSLRRLKLLELSGFKLELLERVRERQIEQAEALDAISLVLPLLLPETERAHLVNLSEERTEGYQGGHVLRKEVRRLRSVGLLKMTGKGYAKELTSDKRFDLADYVELTDLGQRWAHQISRLEEKKESGKDERQDSKTGNPNAES